MQTSERGSVAVTAETGALEGYALPALSPLLEVGLILAFVVFVGFTTIEAPLRYAFTLVGAPWLIYLRDAAILFVMMVLAWQQFWHHRLQPAFVVFGLVLFFHGIVSFLLCNVPLAVLMGLKQLMAILFGASFLPTLLKRKGHIAFFLLVIWLVTATGIIADFQGYAMPWKGMNATVGDYTVVINKKWNFEGEDRIAGFARDSVTAGMIAAFCGTYALLFSRSIVFRVLTAGATLALIYLTTSKGGLLGYFFAIVACLLPMKKSQLPNKLLLVSLFATMILLPIVLPNYLMPSRPALLQSFFDRVERVWPSAWHNIDTHSWIFGAGIGNIGVGQQYLRFENVDPGDNLFVLAYGYFGIFAILYLTWPVLASLRRRSPVDGVGRYAIITLIYLFAYGIVVNVIEDPISAFMLGSAFQALALRKTAAAQDFNPGTYRRAAVAATAISIVLLAVTVPFTWVYARDAAASPFPADAGALNVRDFGALGDGIHDDTNAFIAALAQSSQRAENWHVRIVQVPAGTYRITDTLTKRFPDGSYDAGFILVGAGQSSTVLKLDERAPGFGDPMHPKAVLYTSGKGVAQAPKGGYALRGEGNDGFSNFVEELTVDVGRQNPGAIGIDYLASNQGALRSVTVTGAGRTGVAMTRPWFGPGLLDTVTVKGFDIGVDVGSLTNSVTVDGLTLIGQRQFGIRNVDNLVAAHGLSIQTLGNANEVPAANLSAAGMLVIDGGRIEGGGSTPISNLGFAYLRNLQITGSSRALGLALPAGGELDGVFQASTRVSDAAPAWALTGAAEPLPTDVPIANWVPVDNHAGGDATAALRAALASGARTIYLPFGVYEIRGNLDIPATVHRIVGMNSTILWTPSGQSAAVDDPKKGLLRTRNTSAPLLIEKLFFSCPAGHHVAIEHSGSGPLVLRDIVGMGTIFERDVEGGALYLSDISGGFLLHVAGRSPVWGRQINSEGGGARGGTGSVRITNDGAPIWLLGVKSEGDNTLVANSHGAVTDILGTLFMSLRAASQPLFQSTDSHLDAAGVEVAWKPGASYRSILLETVNGREISVTSDAFPQRPQTQGIHLPRVITQY
jgi:hypothetical protein